MKVREYLTKYNFEIIIKFDTQYNSCIDDFENDFNTLLNVGKSPTKGINIKGYENAIRAMGMKVKAIKSHIENKELLSKMWNYLFATIIAKKRDELFPEEMKKRNRRKLCPVNQ